MVEEKKERKERRKTVPRKLYGEIAALAGQFFTAKKELDWLREGVLFELKKALIGRLDRAQVRAGDFGGLWVSRYLGQVSLSSERVDQARKILGAHWRKVARRSTRYTIDLEALLRLLSEEKISHAQFWQIIKLVHPQFPLQVGKPPKGARGKVEFLEGGSPLTEFLRETGRIPKEE